MRTRKVFQDMFLTQGSWTAWFLGIAFFVTMVRAILAYFHGNDVDLYYNAVFVAANVYMLVIGILAFYFLPYFVENGVTRKEYFRGALLASMGLSVAIPIATYIITVITKPILQNFVTFREETINRAITDTESHIIGDFVLSVFIRPFVELDANWLLSIAIFSLNIFVFYLLGWFIGMSFYRFKTVAGLASIALAIIVSSVLDTLIRASANLPILETFAVISEINGSLSFIIICLLIIAIILLIYQMAKRAPVKI